MQKDKDFIFDPTVAPLTTVESSESPGRENPDFLFNPKHTHLDRTTAVTPSDPQSGLVKSWSISGLKIFEQCAYRTYLQRVKKVKAPDNKYAERGTLIHNLAESYVKGELEELPPELKNFTARFKHLQEEYVNGTILVEDEWAYTPEWGITEWFAPDTWTRAKLDVFLRESPSSAVIIDYKTGKKFGNELSHGQQAIVYAIAAFKRFSELEYIRTEFWYLDQKSNNTLVKEFTREQAEVLLPNIQQRAVRMTTCTNFLPKPSKSNCKWCPYRELGTCEWAEE